MIRRRPPPAADASRPAPGGRPRRTGRAGFIKPADGVAHGCRRCPHRSRRRSSVGTAASRSRAESCRAVHRDRQRQARQLATRRHLGQRCAAWRRHGRPRGTPPIRGRSDRGRRLPATAPRRTGRLPCRAPAWLASLTRLAITRRCLLAARRTGTCARASKQRRLLARPRPRRVQAHRRSDCGGQFVASSSLPLRCAAPAAPAGARRQRRASDDPLPTCGASSSARRSGSRSAWPQVGCAAHAHGIVELRRLGLAARRRPRFLPAARRMRAASSSSCRRSATIRAMAASASASVTASSASRRRPHRSTIAHAQGADVRHSVSSHSLAYPDASLAISLDLPGQTIAFAFDLGASAARPIAAASRRSASRQPATTARLRAAPGIHAGAAPSSSARTAAGRVRLCQACWPWMSTRCVGRFAQLPRSSRCTAVHPGAAACLALSIDAAQQQACLLRDIEAGLGQPSARALAVA